MALGQGPQALLTTLYRSTDCLCRRGAAMKNLAQSASPHAGENNAPLKPGTKHLASYLATGAGGAGARARLWVFQKTLHRLVLPGLEMPEPLGGLCDIPPRR